MSEDEGTVLLVDDERNITALFEAWLGGTYTVRTANDGETALERMDESVDVVLLDRRMPGRSGDEILAAIRERGYDARVAMVTAVEPDFDVLELGFDDYLTKPVEREDLERVVAALMERKHYSDEVIEYFSLAAKKAALESSKPTAKLASSDEYDALVADLETVKSTVTDRLEGNDDFVGAFQDL